MKMLKEKFPNSIKRVIREIRGLKDDCNGIINYKNISSIYKKDKEKRRVFIISAPNHGNLGDQAILHAEEEFLKEHFKDYKVIEIATNDVLPHFRALKNNINKDDILLLHGGGNFGVQYFLEERIRRKIIKNIKNNKIILFPQTIYFGESEFGKSEFEITKKIYSKNSNLILVARENKSYEIMKENFPKNKILLTPDIVFSLNKSKPSLLRNGVLICMRNDLEKSIENDTIAKIDSICNQRFKNVKFTDTVIEKDIYLDDRIEELNKKWDEFKSAELVITDRLHGMVFAAITETPCLVFSNYNHKVKGTYEWIKQCEYIKYIDCVDDIEVAMGEVLNNAKTEYNNDNLKELYKQILDELI